MPEPAEKRLLRFPARPRAGSRRLPVGRIAVAVALAVGIWALTQGASPVRWRTLAPGLEFALLRGDPYCRSGSAAIAVLRIDPARHRLRVRHYTTDAAGAASPPGLVEWQRRLQAEAVFNAGQYYPGYRYMGMLVSGGRVVSRRAHPEFKAALVAHVEGGRSSARVVDLERESLDPRRNEWDEIAQSFMLFDRTGGVRVRKSDRVAHRTLVGEDGSGRIVVVTTEGGYTLHDVATFLIESPLGLTHAMSMDGGLEAGLLVEAGGLRYASFGSWPREGEPEAAAALVPLPAVIEVSAIEARRPAPAVAP